MFAVKRQESRRNIVNMSADTNCTHKHIGLFDAGENLKLTCNILTYLVNYYYSFIRHLLHNGQACCIWR